MTSLFTQALHCLPPETAHECVKRSLQLWQKLCPPKPPQASLSIPGIAKPLANRVGIAGGFDKDAEFFPALQKLGFGFLEVGTVTVLPQAGNPKPRIFRIKENSLVNRMGFPNCGLEEFRKHLEELAPLVHVPLFINIGKGKDTPLDKAVSDYQKLFEGLKDWADAFVINISSPNTVGIRDLQSEAFLKSLTKHVPSQIPCFVKIAPDIQDLSLRSVIKAVNETPIFCGVISGNTSIELAQKHGYSTGGLSGHKLSELSLSVVKKTRSFLNSDKLLIGLGGVDSLKKAEAMRNAGADLIQLYTGFVYKGPKLVRKLGSKLT